MGRVWDLCVHDISFTKAKYRSQEPIIFRVCFNSPAASPALSAPACEFGDNWVAGLQVPSLVPETMLCRGAGGGRAQQQRCSTLGPEQHNTQSFCRQLVRPELLVLWKLAPELNGSYAILADCQPLKTAMVPSKI